MTEKNYNPKQKETSKMFHASLREKEKKAMKKQPAKIVNTPIKEKKIENKKEVETKNIEKIQTDNSTPTEIKKDEKIEEKTEKNKKKQIKKIKKSEVVVNAKSVPISTKYSIAICKFIKNKKIEKAIKDLQEVVAHKKPVPMKGEIPHRKGKIMSGRFPKKASEHFIILLKSLMGNANNHDVEEPIIVEAIANFASRPFGKFGKVKRKRTHITLKAMEKKLNKKEKKK